MARLGNVQNKIACVFNTKVVEESSTKRSNQPFKVVACDELRGAAVNSGIEDVCRTRASEKLDGTCVCVQVFDGRPWLWARHDRKPSKATEKRFKRFQQQHRAWQVGDRNGSEPVFVWNPAVDFKEPPPHWVAATGVDIVDGVCQPDDGGHTPGWVPVDPKSRQHCWHLDAVDLLKGLALVLRPAVTDQAGERGDTDSGVRLELTVVPLRELDGTTSELIGTNVNGNPYKMGSKQQPIHCLVRHGSIPFTAPPPLNFDSLRAWFEKNAEGQVEGIVWHCSDGSLFKVHRHHLGLKWPVNDLRLLCLPVQVVVDPAKYELDTEAERPSLFGLLAKMHTQHFESVDKITLNMAE